MKTGLFDHSRSNVLIEDTLTGVNLLFCMSNYQVVRHLNIEYSRWSSRFYPKQFRSEIQKRLQLKRGGVIPHPDVEVFLRNLRMV